MNRFEVGCVSAAAFLAATVCSAQVTFVEVPSNYKALGVSDDGQTVILQPYDSGQSVLRWTPAGGIEQIWSDPSNPAGFEFVDVSSNGAVVAGRSYRTALIITPQETYNLRDTTNWGSVLDLSADGSTAVGWWNLTIPSTYDPMRWKVTSHPDSLLPSPDSALFAGYRNGNATSVSNDGSVVVGQFRRKDGTRGIFHWTHDTGFSEVVGAPGSIPPIVSGDGERIYFKTESGVSVWSDSAVHPVGDPTTLPPELFWAYLSSTDAVDAFVHQTLEDAGYDVDGWQFSLLVASEQGTAAILYATDPSGARSHVSVSGFHVVPEPATYAPGTLLLLAGAVLVRKRRRPTTSHRHRPVAPAPPKTATADLSDHSHDSRMEAP